ncbi:MAG: hypothetical protein SVU88_00580 [Candidatus Nanohaloarchaea archaeon]|nr:hypothetical protein [Candidatus Nanohaloarchaea archaeon]
MAATKLLLDANFLVLPFQESVDIFSEFERVVGRHELYTLNRTYNEALDLEDGQYRQQVERLVEEHGIEVVSRASEKAVDDLLVELAGEYVVCTNDGAVRAELRERDLPHIYLRQRSHLEAENLRPSAF